MYLIRLHMRNDDLFVIWETGFFKVHIFILASLFFPLISFFHFSSPTSTPTLTKPLSHTINTHTISLAHHINPSLPSPLLFILTFLLASLPIPSSFSPSPSSFPLSPFRLLFLLSFLLFSLSFLLSSFPIPPSLTLLSVLLFSLLFSPWSPLIFRASSEGGRVFFYLTKLMNYHSSFC